MRFFTEFKKLYIKNALMFKKEIEIPLSNQGIISVIGINKDANGSNGAGKSTLFDILRAVHLGSSADGRKDIDFLSNKGESSIGYTARYGNDEFEITKNRGDKTFGNNTIILKNGESVGFKKDNNATKKSIYQEFVKIPEAVWDNCVILRTDKAHTLIRGTPSERIEFISNLCSLNCYDEINKVLKEKLNEVTNEIDSLAIYPADCPGEFTQALMELGATVCVPGGEPKCGVCPCREFCEGRESWQELPVKLGSNPTSHPKKPCNCKAFWGD